jgi:hypothetical protein
MEEGMDPFVISTIILGIWGAVGPLVGIFVGHWLTKRWQREQWIADNQRDEYRKLLAGLNRLNMTLSSGHVHGTENPEELQRAMEDISVASNTSLFITDFLAESNVLGNILMASRAFAAGGSFESYTGAHN